MRFANVFTNESFKRPNRAKETRNSEASHVTAIGVQ